jgi:hypothetical protein
MVKKILICGDRNWSDKHFIKDKMKDIDSSTIIIEGGCKGVDKLSAEVAKEMGLTIKEYPADWTLGKKAGPIRNRKMLEEKPDEVWAFHNNIEKSKGTKDMINAAKKKNIFIRIFKHSGIKDFF